MQRALAGSAWQDGADSRPSQTSGAHFEHIGSPYATSVLSKGEEGDGGEGGGGVSDARVEWSLFLAGHTPSVTHRTASA